MTRSPAFSPSLTSQLSPTVRTTLIGRGSTFSSAPTTMTMASPFGIAGHAALRDEDGVFVYPLLQNGAHEHAGEQRLFRVREDRPQGNGTGALVHRDLRKFERSRQRIGAAVLQQQLDPRLGCRVAFSSGRWPGSASGCSSSALDWVTSTYMEPSCWMVASAAGWLAVTSAPSVTVERPIRPEIGAVTLV